LKYKQKQKHKKYLDGYWSERNLLILSSHVSTFFQGRAHTFQNVGFLVLSAIAVIVWFGFGFGFSSI
jgi:hypothetical protein